MNCEKLLGLIGLILMIAVCGCLGGNSDSTGPLTVDSIKERLPASEKEDIITIAGPEVTGDVTDVLINRTPSVTDHDWMDRTNLERTEVDIFKNLFEDSRLGGVIIRTFIKTEDIYGQKGEPLMAVNSYMSRNTYAKINWDNFSQKNINRVVDSFWVSESTPWLAPTD